MTEIDNILHSWNHTYKTEFIFGLMCFNTIPTAAKDLLWQLLGIELFVLLQTPTGLGIKAPHIF
jgi:hypothetical protein